MQIIKKKSFTKSPTVIIHASKVARMWAHKSYRKPDKMAQARQFSIWETGVKRKMTNLRSV